MKNDLRPHKETAFEHLTRNTADQKILFWFVLSVIFGIILIAACFAYKQPTYGYLSQVTGLLI